MVDFNKVPHVVPLFDWIVGIIGTLQTHQVDLFLMCLWVVWTERNNIMWNNGVFNTSHMATGALKHLEEYQRCHPCPVKNSKRLLLAGSVLQVGD